MLDPADCRKQVGSAKISGGWGTPEFHFKEIQKPCFGVDVHCEYILNWQS